MTNVLFVMGLLGFLGLVATSTYETWLGVSLREPSMTRILFGASISLKLLLILTLAYVMYAIHFPQSLLHEYFGLQVREYLRPVLYGGLLLQTISVSIALYRWDRRAVRIPNREAERQLVVRQRELHDKLSTPTLHLGDDYKQTTD